MPDGKCVVSIPRLCHGDARTTTTKTSVHFDDDSVSGGCRTRLDIGRVAKRQKNESYCIRHEPFSFNIQMCMTCVANGFRARLAKISGRILNVDELITVRAGTATAAAIEHTHTGYKRKLER